MRLAAWFGRQDVERFAGEISKQEFDAWIATGITSWPELLANGFTAVARAMGSKIRADDMRHWEPVEVISEEAMIARMNNAYAGKK